jgi:replicative DNA helicase
MSAQFRDSNVESLRIPPQSTDAEQSVLGGLMLAPAALALISDWLVKEDFYRRDHQMIYQAIVDLAEKKTPFDAVTLGEWFEAQGLSEYVAGGAYLIDLASTTPSAANIVAYAEIVRDKAVLRSFIGIGTEMVNSGFNPSGRDSRDLIAEASRNVAQLAGNPRAGGVKTMKDVGLRWFAEMQRRYADKGGLLGLPTPWGKFNTMTAGFKPGELIVIAGRPSMGKSAFAVNVATANALSGKRVLFFNLEMTDVSIYNRAIGSIMSVPLQWLRKPTDDHDESETFWTRVTEGVRLMAGAKLLIDDTPALNREQIIARAKREHMRQPLDMVIVDHLHLMTLAGKTRETVEIGHITRDLKGLSKELNCPVVLLSQLNRGLETRAGSKRPVMADLRESGNIEQDADLIVFLYRDDYYAEKEERASEYPGFIEIIVGKQREGETGKVWARDRLAYGCIDDYDGPAPFSHKQSAPKDQTTRKRWGTVAGVDA